jgi:hypothetical protein
MGGWLHRLRRPWVAVLLIVAVGILGGVLVYRSGGRIREQDRAAFLAWERLAQPAVERAREIHAGLPSLIEDARAAPGQLGPLLGELRMKVTRTRLTLQRARTEVQTVRVERVLEGIAAAYLEAIARDLQAVAALEKIAGDPEASRSTALARAEQRHQTASLRFREGDEASEQLRARLRLVEN